MRATIHVLATTMTIVVFLAASVANGQQSPSQPSTGSINMLVLLALVITIGVGTAVGKALAAGLKEDHRKTVGGIWVLIGVVLVIYGINRFEYGQVRIGQAAMGFGIIAAVTGIVVTAAKGSSRGAAHISSTKKCPFCAETVQAEATVCRYCNRTLEVSTSSQPS